MSSPASDLRHDVIESAEDLARFQAIAEQCFRFPSSYWEPYVANVGRENFRAAWRGGELVGGYAYYPLGQFFGGKRLAMAGVAVVGVPPEERAHGVAAAMMADGIRAMRARGYTLATLFASTQRVYRKVGYEQAGSRNLYRLATADLPHSRERLPMQRAPLVAEGVLGETYLRWAERTNGQLDRSAGLWRRVLRVMEAPVIAYVAGDPGRPEGYVVYEHSGGFGRPQEIEVRDLVALTPAALTSLFSLLWDHRSVARTTFLYGPALDPRLALWNEQTEKLDDAERWLLRILDLPTALTGRGYPAEVDADLHLEVHDELVAENSGRWRLRVKGGAAVVERGGEGRLRADIRGLAPLWSGLFAPTSLAELGWIHGDDGSLSSASALFAGPEPWMTDGF